MYAWIIFIVAMIVVFASLIWAVEYVVALVKKIPPEMPSGRKMRMAVISEIKKYCPNATSIIDIGSGFGGMALKIARAFPGAGVIGVERMPFAYVCSWIFTFFYFQSNLKFKRDRFTQFMQDKKFDVGVSYSGPSLMAQVEDVFQENKFKVVISVDFPLPNVKPVRTIKLHRDMLGQHTLYIYENGGQ